MIDTLIFTLKVTISYGSIYSNNHINNYISFTQENDCIYYKTDLQLHQQ